MVNYVVNSGQSATGLTVNKGDTLTVSAGGLATATLVTSGGSVVNDGTVSGTTIGSGGSSYTAGNSISTTIQAGGKEEVGGGTVLNATVLSGGTQLDDGGGSTVIGTTVNSGGTLSVGGLANVYGPVINGGGRLVVDAGNTSGANLQSGATVLVEGDARLVGSLINPGVTVSFGNYAYNDYEAGVLAQDTIAGAVTVQGVTTYPYAYYAASNTAIASSTSNTVVNGGVLTIASLGTDGSTEVMAGGVLVNAGGSISSTRLDLGRALLIDFLPFGTGGTAVYSPSGNLLIVSESGEQYTQTLSGNYAGKTFQVAEAAGGGTLVTIACFCAGTSIAVPGGETPVENIQHGDLVLTASGQARPVRWVGRRSYAGRFLAANRKAHPVRLRAGCLGDGVPRRDLLVSPEHAMLLDGVLVPAECLVNGRTVVQGHDCRRVDYYHIELDTHDAILAEGAAAETFLDDDSRGLFQNAADYSALYPDAPPSGAFCAARVTEGPVLETVRQRLAAVADRLAAAA